MNDIDTLLTQEFIQAPDLVYLNHAAVAPWPVRTQRALAAFAHQNVFDGASNYPTWQKQEDLLRAQFAELITAQSVDDIALLKSTSEGLSVIAYGIEWATGDNVVISNQEFPSNRIVWESLAAKGVEVIVADLGTNESAQALISACNDRTRLVSVSSIQYASGLRLDLQPLGRYCRENTILFCIDAIQSLGAFEFNCQVLQADFVVADGHKWMLGPEGLALFYSTAEARKQLKLQQFGWHMVEAAGDYAQHEWQEAKTARRFECGSPNMLGAHALSASLSLILEVGLPTITERILERSRELIEQLSTIDGIEILSPTDDAARSGIVTFKHQSTPSIDLYQALMQRRVICANRGGGVRFSPHFYTSKQHLERAINAVQDITRTEAM